MKPVYQSRKVWTTLASVVAVYLAEYLGRPDMAPLLAALGGALIIAIGMADWGKEARALEREVLRVLDVRGEDGE